MRNSEQQFSVTALFGLITAVTIGLALLRVGHEGSAFFLLGVVVLFAVGGGVIGYVGHGREGIVSGAILFTFLGVLTWPLVGTVIIVLAEVIHSR